MRGDRDGLLGRAAGRGLPLQVERQEAGRDLLVRQVMGPAVGVQHGLAELAVGLDQPGGGLL